MDNEKAFSSFHEQKTSLHPINSELLTDKEKSKSVEGELFLSSSLSKNSENNLNQKKEGKVTMQVFSNLLSKK